MDSAKASFQLPTSRDALLSHKRTAGANKTYTVDEVIEAVGMGHFQYYVLALSGLFFIADSMEMLLLSFIKSALRCEFNLTNAQAALVTTSVGVGMLVGNVVWGMVGDAKGRRFAFIAASCQTLVFGLLAAASPSYWVLIVTRGLTGIGIGGNHIAFSLIMEFLPSKSRGTWGMGLSVFWSLGAVVEAQLAMHVVPKFGWRALMVLSSTPLVFLIALSSFVPESPRWLAARGRFDEAKAVVERAAVANSRALPQGALVVNQPEPQQCSTFDNLRVLVKPRVTALLLKLWILWFSAAFTYYGAVVLQPDMLEAEDLGKRCTYTKDMCSTQASSTTCATQPLCSWNGVQSCVPAGLARLTLPHSSIAPGRNAACDSQLSHGDYMSSLWATTGEIPGTLLTLLMVDRVGRRASLVFTYAISAIAFVMLVPCPGRFAETALFFTIRAASNGYFQAIFLYTNELLPVKVRATAMGVCSAVARVGLVMTPLVGQFLDSVNFMLAIAIYSGSCIISVLAILITQIETTGRPLLASIEELETLLLGKDAVDDDYAPFANDPTAHPFVRFWRLPARIDGLGVRIRSTASAAV